MILIKRDSKKKIRIIEIKFSKTNEESYEIKKWTGLHGGKLILQPIILIEKGKAKRTILEQTELQYNSLVSKYLDKGYKALSKLGISTLNDKDLDSKVPLTNTDKNGAPKPQLAKSSDAITDKNIFNLKYKGSAKLDGVRCNIRLDGVIKTNSRGGKDYDVQSRFIIEELNKSNVFEMYPNLILDGEIYIHGKPLNYINKLCSTATKLIDDHELLNYHIYDIADESLTFSDRIKILEKLKVIFNNCSHLFIENQIDVSGWDDIISLHNDFVSDGYEGLVIRSLTDNYKFGGRDNRMIKIKQFSDDEFLITGYTEKSRVEDFCFNLITEDGNPFEAKPIGTYEDKMEYLKNMKDIIGKQGTVKYFGYTNTNTPVPNIPIFKSIRENDV